MIIIQDSREQLPWEFRKSKFLEGTEVNKLEVGDYSIKGYEDKIAIERKSPRDIFGTLGQGHDRFKRELERGSEYDYIGIVIEASFNDVKNKKFPYAFKTKMRGDVVIKQLMTIEQKYPNVHVHFCNNRMEARSLVRSIFLAYENEVKRKQKIDNSMGDTGLSKKE